MTATATRVSVEFDVIWVGEVTAPKAWVFRPRGGGGPLGLPALLNPVGDVVRLPLLAFAVHHPTAGTVLVDTGLHPDAADTLRGDYGLLTWLVFRSLRTAPEDFASQLRQLDIAPEAIEQVVMTHLHADHTSGMRLLPAAEFVSTREEWAAATHARSAVNGYMSRHLPPGARVRQIDFDRSGERHGPFARTVDLLGDGSIRLVSTPGHTSGHMSVLLQMPEGPALLIGDAVYTLRSLEQEILPFRTVDDDVYRRSLHEVRTFQKTYPEAVLIPTHDESAWRRHAGPP